MNDGFRLPPGVTMAAIPVATLQQMKETDQWPEDISL